MGHFIVKSTFVSGQKVFVSNGQSLRHASIGNSFRPAPPSRCTPERKLDFDGDLDTHVSRRFFARKVARALLPKPTAQPFSYKNSDSMPKRSTSIRPARRGVLKLTAGEERLHNTFGEVVGATLSSNLETIVRAEISRLTSQLLLLGKTDADLLAKAVSVFENERNAANWLVTPQRFSKNATPIELAISDSGRAAVIEELGRIEHGVYS